MKSGISVFLTTLIVGGMSALSVSAQSVNNSISTLTPAPIMKGILPPKPVKVSTRARGIASYYSPKYTGKCCTANGEKYNPKLLTAAHPTLPFGTRVRVTNLINQRSVVVRVNDRGPFKKGRVIDLSPNAFSMIGNLKVGLLKVKIEALPNLSVARSNSLQLRSYKSTSRR